MKKSYKMKFRFTVPVFMLFLLAGSCQQKPADNNENTANKSRENQLSFEKKCHSEEFILCRGVNISHWLSQSSRRGKERKQFFTERDIKFISEIGYDHIRLPIDEEQLWDEQNNKIPEAFTLLHNAINWCTNQDLKVVVDLHIIRAHHFNKEEKPLWTDPREQIKFINLWKQLSAELGKYPVNMVAYELMNEAVADDPQDWNNLIAKTLDTLRKLEPARKIVVGSNRWQNVDTFKDLVVPDDENLILSFHFYIPFLLTHHTASWVKIGEYDGPVNYPGKIVNEEDMDGLPEDLRQEMSHYTKVYTKDSLESLIMLPVEYARERGLPLYCGEWGCLPSVEQETRLRWYADVKEILERHDIGWANWDYKGGFGIINESVDNPNIKLIKTLMSE